MISAWVWGEEDMSVIGSRGIERAKDATYLHADVGITHTTINGQLRQFVSAVKFHGIQNGLRLETGGLHGRAGNVPTLSVLGDTNWEKVSNVTS